MATEPVNERPIFPSMIRADSIGVGNWSVSMIRQLTTVFQQYGFRLNKALLDEDLASHDNGDGTIPEVDQENTWVASQIFQNAPTANGHPLRWQELARNGGTIPEVGQDNTFTGTNNFTQMPQFDGSGLLQFGSNSNGTWLVLAGMVQICYYVDASTSTIDGDPYSANLTFPRAFASVPYINPSRQTVSNAQGYDTATSEPHAVNATTSDFDWQIHDTASTTMRGYFAIGDPS